MQQGIFPDIYKVAQVIPLFKGGDKEDMNCYRPISLLPALGKLFEKVISTRMVNFFDKNNLFSPQQFGFREKFSTEHAILDIHEKLLKNLNDGLTSCDVFLDLAKAFDSVSHDILLSKLEKYGIRGNVLSLFKSYLCSRTQFVKIDSSASELINILFGVPQGSILGPLLFLIYINDLPDATNFFIRLFADDTFLCAQNKNIMALESEVNTELLKVYNWLASNKLTLNISKSKFMIITNKKNIPVFEVKVNNDCLDKCDSYKYLGVYIDKDLSWKPHIDYICKKISKACGALSKLRHCVGIATLRTVYYALVHSYLRYGILAWGNASLPVLCSLNTLNNKVLRIMTFAPLGRLDTSIIYDHLNVLTIEKLFCLESAKFIYKSKNDLLPLQTIATHFTRSAVSNHSHFTRHRLRNNNVQLSVVPYELLSSFAQKSIQHKAYNIWSNIPLDIRQAESFNIFKCLFKRHLLTF